MENEQGESKPEIFVLLDKLRNGNTLHKELSIPRINELKNGIVLPLNLSTDNFDVTKDSSVHSDLLNNMRSNQGKIIVKNGQNVSDPFIVSIENNPVENKTYNYFINKDDVTQSPRSLRKKRATPFIYEPYKIIRETQAQDTKKTTIIPNVSPLIKQMQTSKVVDRVTRANKEPENGYIGNRPYKDIGREDRSKPSDTEKTSDTGIVDINVDQRRGEPRYEMKPANHKTEYTPVVMLKSMSVEDFKSQSNTEKHTSIATTKRPPLIRRNSRQRRPTIRPLLDKSNLLQTTTEIQDAAASNTVTKTIATTTSRPLETSRTSFESEESAEDSDSDEEYEEYDDEEEETTTTTSTTTQKPTIRRRIRISTTTKKPHQLSTEAPRLRLVTRFRNYNLENTVPKTEKYPDRPIADIKHKNKDKEEVTIPKYREKKKKSSKSTIVTDTKKYGDDDEEDTRREEVDALIGIKHDIDDYIPLYEKEAKLKHKHRKDLSNEESVEEDHNDSIEEEDNDNEEDDSEEQVESTTPEPTKRTLLKTTDAPKPTVASRTNSHEQKPIISKKTIEIHEEIPINKSSPHISEYKQDIKEVEIIKEIPQSPKKKQEKHTEVLDLFRDDNLATDVNKLGDVEVFKVDLDLKNGPRHGGNYRRAPENSVSPITQNEGKRILKDAETSESENTKHVELNERSFTRMHGGNLKSMGDFSRSRNSGRNAKLVEFSDITQAPPRVMHGGNLRLDSKTRRGGRKYEKLIELDDDSREHDSDPKEDNYRTHSSRNGGAMHGGNYRSAKLVQDKNIDSEYDIKVKTDKGKDPKRRAAVLLNSFAQAVPVLTTTPGYILDPSKRMYYYVEA